MAKPENTVWRLLDANRRYYAEVIGKHLEEKYDIDNSWRNKSGWEQIIEYFNRECIYCGCHEGDEIEIKVTNTRGKRKTQTKLSKSIVKFQKEHLDSIYSGGLDIKGNVVPACAVCNNEKSHKGWNEFINEKLSKTKAIKKVGQIEKYRNEKSKWKQVENDELVQEYKKMLDIKLQNAVETALKWVTNEFYGDELYQYLYHITTQSKWEENEKEYSAQFSFGGQEVTVCSYEFLLSHYLEHTSVNNLPKNGEKLIILSFEKDEIEAQCNSFDFQGASLYQINGSIPKSKIISSNFFDFSSFQDIRNELKNSINHSLTSKNVYFSGYEIND